ncbi:hypothetical protein AZI86_16500 [Bdellovibrio bacteriovorus]|uniref:Uncharacterized protein n=1 Tax=Bdellovibrio bacteriovorus TaxID=959 RepID=A0A150WGX9_BDEBC|nr:hypothetical protein [Bdellovibrio bacteriovorus]KYG62432.1 hypothetical protein AZI86_16500 [Bdellovibrio bacteriovorus]
MYAVLIALFFGILAGLIDILPMIKNKNIPRVSIASLFAQWVFIGLLIPFVSWDMAPWFKGAVIGFLGMIPTMIVTSQRNPKATLPTAICGLLLGAAIGTANYFVSGPMIL